MKAVRTEPRRPAAFRLDDPLVEAEEEAIVEALEPEAADEHRAVEAIAHPRRRGIRWGALALATGGALVTLTLGVAFDALVRSLFARADWLGVLGLTLIAAFALALIALIARELAGLFRLKRLARLRFESDEGAARNERDPVAGVLKKVVPF